MTYSLVVNDNSGNAVTACTKNGLTTTLSSCTLPSGSKKKFYWQVWAKGALGSATEASGGFWYVYVNQASNPFSKISPANNTGLTSYDVTFSWAAASTPEGGAIRDMMNPHAYQQPAKVSDNDPDSAYKCYASCNDDNDNGGVHTNSGVPNHAYALMVDGGTYNGFTINGIGLTKAAKIEYRVLTYYLTNSSQFADNYNLLKQSCTDLIGTAGITSADCDEVGKALDAVEMNQAVCGGTGGGGSGFTGNGPSQERSRAEHMSVAQSELEQTAGAPVRVLRSRANGLATFISSDPAHPVSMTTARSASAADRARAFVQQFGALVVLDSLDQVRVLRTSKIDEVGMEHVRLQQLHNGVPVHGGELTVHLRGTSVVFVHAKTVAELDSVDTNPQVSADDALATVQDLLATQFPIAAANLSQPRLEILNPGHFMDEPAESHLTWFVEVTTADRHELIWVDAHTGGILLHFNQMPHLKNRSVYDSNNSATLPGTLVRSEGEAATGDADVDSAYIYAGDTYD